ncbi:hypothetical protein HF313_17730 [Massilia atriviolacea]|uniref:Uncharacterized protein n=1 Tax=Massilia atriviolacea TaxID=2495579 RepID=A0A430HTS0_9BURK|nr:hypothetical protein [Massilia atriviolacea]RSZ60872.1 hypothetical protein EJB06_01665 [Massilia atriviolacea]
MSLPELAWQIVYGRAAWAIVLAALIVALWPRAWQLARARLAAIAACAALPQMLPGEASPAFWLGLVFQWPSALLVRLSALKLHCAWQGRPATKVMPAPLAALVALAGVALYLDAIGLLSQGFFYAGFGPRGAPLLALLLAVLCSAAIVRGHARPQAAAVLAALLLFAVLRLPTGNLWDTLLDPFLWAWALLSLAARFRHRSTRAASTTADAAQASPVVF